MPYNSLDELPSYIRRKPIEVQKKWMEVFNSCWEKNSDLPVKDREAKCFRTANGVIKGTKIAEKGNIRWFFGTRVGAHAYGYVDGKLRKFTFTREALEKCHKTWVGKKLTLNHKYEDKGEIIDTIFDDPFVVFAVRIENEETLKRVDNGEITGVSIEIESNDFDENYNILSFVGTGLTVVFYPEQPACDEEMGCGYIGAVNSENSWRMSTGKINITCTVIPYQDLPLAPENTPWDRSAAEKRIREWAGGENIDWNKYGKAFFYHDPDKRNAFSGYKLPYADVIDGELKVVWNAIKAVRAVLSGARGGVDIPQDEKDRILKQVERYYKKFNKSFGTEVKEMGEKPCEEKVKALEAELKAKEEKIAELEATNAKIMSEKEKIKTQMSATKEEAKIAAENLEKIMKENEEMKKKLKAVEMEKIQADRKEKIEKLFKDGKMPVEEKERRINEVTAIVDGEFAMSDEVFNVLIESIEARKPIFSTKPTIEAGKDPIEDKTKELLEKVLGKRGV